MRYLLIWNNCLPLLLCPTHVWLFWRLTAPRLLTEGEIPLSIVGAALPVISEPDEVKDIFVCESGTARRPARVPVVSFNSRSPLPPASGRARLPHLGSGGSRPAGTPSSSSSIEVESDDISSADSPQTGQLN
uniref:Uncharacterized protein n=1 Tax=Oryza glumipatula TaxID=40148 RepID=A0A0E0B290_9ORYZ